MRIRQNKLNKVLFFSILSFIILLIFYLANITPGLKGSLDQELRIFFKQSDRILSNSLKTSGTNLFYSFKHWKNNEQNFETLKIDISFKNLKILKEERKKALEIKYNLSRQKIPIDIDFKNKKYKASARLKGGLSDHFGYNKQFSLMIKLRNNETINGMNEFALTQHAPRQFPNNVVYSKLLSSLNIYMPNFITYEIKVNGDDWGLMLAEEHYSNFYYKLRNKNYSPTVKFTNEDNSDLRRVLSSEFGFNINNNLYKFLEYRHGKLENKIFNRNDFIDSKYSNIISNLKDIKYDLTKNKIDISEYDSIFDMNKFSKIIILAIITGDYHALGYRNIRFYYNEETNKLEPIPTDWGYVLRKINSEKQVENELFNLINCTVENCTYHNHFIYDNIIKNKNFQKYFFNNLSFFLNEINFIKIYLEDLCKDQINCKNKINYKILEENLLILMEDIDYIKIFNKFFKNEKKLFLGNETSINNNVSYKYLKTINNAIYARVFQNGNIRIINLTPYPIEIFLMKLKRKDCEDNEIDSEIKNDCYMLLDKKINLSVTDLEYENFNLNVDISEFEKIEIYSRYKKLDLNPSLFFIENQNYIKLIKFNNQQLG